MAQPWQPAEIDQLVDCEHEFLRLKQKGFHLEAIKYMELSLTLRKRIFGSNSSEVVDAARVLAASYTTIAMNCIQKEDYDQAYEILKTKTVVLAGLTFNKTDQGIEVLCKTRAL